MSSNSRPAQDPAPQDPGGESPDRRTFLKRSLLGGALLLAGSGTLLALRKGKTTPAAPAPLLSFDPAIFPVVLAVIGRVLPFPDVDPVAIALKIDTTLTYAPPAVRRDLNKVYALLENSLAGLLTRGSITPFTLLSAEGQDRALKSWRDSRVAPLTAAYHGLRKLVLSAYYGNLDNAMKVGYPGPFFEKADPGPLQARGPISRPFAFTPPAAKEKSRE